MSALNINEFIEKIATANRQGLLNDLTATRLGVDRFTIREAAASLGTALYIKRAQYIKIAEGIEATKQLGVKLSSLGRLMRGAGAGLQANTRPTAVMGAQTAQMPAMAAPKRNAAIMQAVEAPMQAGGLQGLGGGSIGRLLRGLGRGR
jgi:hypothetical protein